MTFFFGLDLLVNVLLGFSGSAPPSEGTKSSCADEIAKQLASF